MPAVFSVNYWFAFAVAFASTSQFFTTILSVFLPLIKRFTGATESNLSKIEKFSLVCLYRTRHMEECMAKVNKIVNRKNEIM